MDVHLRFKKWMSVFKFLCEINHLILKQSNSSNSTVLFYVKMCQAAGLTVHHITKQK